MRLFGQLVRFPSVTRDARRDNIVPARPPMLVAWDYVIEIQVFGLEALLAILAAEVVPSVNILS